MLAAPSFAGRNTRRLWQSYASRGRRSTSQGGRCPVPRRRAGQCGGAGVARTSPAETDPRAIGTGARYSEVSLCGGRLLDDGDWMVLQETRPLRVALGPAAEPQGDVHAERLSVVDRRDV